MSTEQVLRESQLISNYMGLLRPVLSRLDESLTRYESVVDAISVLVDSGQPLPGQNCPERSPTEILLTSLIYNYTLSHLSSANGSITGMIEKLNRLRP